MASWTMAAGSGARASRDFDPPFFPLRPAETGLAAVPEADAVEGFAAVSELPAVVGFAATAPPFWLEPDFAAVVAGADAVVPFWLEPDFAAVVVVAGCGVPFWLEPPLPPAFPVDFPLAVLEPAPGAVLEVTGSGSRLAARVVQAGDVSRLNDRVKERTCEARRHGKRTARPP